MIDWLSMINWLLIVAALTILCAGFLARRRLAQIEAVKAHRRRFFEAAEALASDDRTPDELLRLVHRMAELIPSRTVLWRVVWFAVTGEMARAVQQPTRGIVGGKSPRCRMSCKSRLWRPVSPSRRRSLTTTCVWGR